MVASMQPADVNWMLSSEVQSGAALVAIVGGLLGSRYVSLHAEQGAARRRLQETSSRLGRARKRKIETDAELTNLVVADLLDDNDCYVWILQHGGTSTLEQVLHGRSVEDEYRDALETHLRMIERELAKAKRQLSELIPRTETQETWASFRAAHGLTPDHEPVWEWMYEFISDAHSREARKAAAGWPSLNVSDIGLVGASMPVVGQLQRAQRVGRLRAVQEETGREVYRLEGEEAAARSYLDSTQQPQGFWIALIVLAYIAIVCIAVPLALMVEGSTAYSFGVRLFLAILFATGVVALLGYLFLYSRHLRRRD